MENNNGLEVFKINDTQIQEAQGTPYADEDAEQLEVSNTLIRNIK